MKLRLGMILLLGVGVAVAAPANSADNIEGTPKVIMVKPSGSSQKVANTKTPQHSKISKKNTKKSSHKHSSKKSKSKKKHPTKKHKSGKN